MPERVDGVIGTIFDNIQILITKLLPEKSAFRIPLVRAIFNGLTARSVALHVPDIPLWTLDKALGRDGDDYTSSTMFKSNIRKKMHRVSQIEVNVTLETLEPHFVPKSGQRYATKWTRLSRSELYDKYVASYEQIFLRSGGTIPLYPRTYKSFYNSVLKKTRIHKLKHPHDCPLCNKDFLPNARNVLLKYNAELLECDSEKKKRQYRTRINNLQEKINGVDLHRQKMNEQRSYYTFVRDNLAPDECVLVMDYVSSYYSPGSNPLGVGGKYNILVITVEYRIQGQTHVSQRYFDYPCATVGNKHDSLHLSHAVLHFFEDSDWMIVNGKPRFQKIWRVSDNGQPFKSVLFLYLESYLTSKFKLQYEVIFLCAYHAFSICDAHGGTLKRVLRSAEIKQITPLDAVSYRRVVDEQIKDTTSTMIFDLDIEKLNATYELVGGRTKIIASEALKQYSSLKYSIGTLDRPETLGCVHARSISSSPYLWDDMYGIDFSKFPTWRFVWLVKHEKKVCILCPLNDGKIIFDSDHMCPFRSKIIAYRTAAQISKSSVDDDVSSSTDMDSEFLEQSTASESDEPPQRRSNTLYEVERIEDDYEESGIRQFLVKWKGYPEDENTWEIDLPIESVRLYMEAKSVLIIYYSFTM